MRWTLFAACAALFAGLWLPGEAAQPAATETAAIPGASSPPPTDIAGPAAAAPSATEEPITFEKYRDWRLNFIERRRAEIAIQLETTDLPPAQKTRLERAKAYYEWFAGLPESERDSRFRHRFEQIDTNRDGTIDAAERAAWRDKRRIFYRRDRASVTAPAEASAH